jgi:hypothetical protein
LILNVVTDRGCKGLKREVKSLQDEFVLLKTAIEEAINKGQKSSDDLTDIPRSVLVSDKEFAFTHTNAGFEVID